MHLVSSYPSPEKDLNLKLLEKFKKNIGVTLDTQVMSQHCHQQ